MNEKNKKILISVIIIIVLISSVYCLINNIRVSKESEEVINDQVQMAADEKSDKGTQVSDVTEKKQKEKKVNKDNISIAEKEVAEEDTMTIEIEKILKEMTLEQKVAQMFFITPDTLMDTYNIITIDETFETIYKKYSVGGIILFDGNIENEDQLRVLNKKMQETALETINVPLLIGIDEEGGKIVRIEKNSAFDVKTFESMSTIGERGDVEKAYEIGQTISAYLADYGFNIDFAPVADVLTNSNNTVVKDRAFSSNPEVVLRMNEAIIKGLEENGIYGVPKHFPGHGDTAADTHNGYAYTDKTLDMLKKIELIPFQNVIDQGVEFIMVGHVAYPNVTGQDIPASLSKEIITDLLIENMGFEGIVITDALNMGAIVNHYNSKEVAITAVNSGVDMILMPNDFIKAYEGLLNAVKSGEVSEERIDESVRKILGVKLENK